MKILYGADFHGDYEALDNFFSYANSRDDIDVIVPAGDLIGAPLDEEQMRDFLEVKQILGGIREQNQIPSSLGKIASTLIEREETPEKLRNLAESYNYYSALSEENMIANYEQIKEKISELSVPVLTVPGNWDGKCLEEILDEENLHLKTREIDDVKFAGYGGSEVIPVFMPEELAIEYKEGMNGDHTFYSQPYGFLSQENPDIAVVHNPPFGSCDISDNLEKVVDQEYDDKDGGHVGSPGIAQYILKNSPKVVLAGHIHESAGVEQTGDTYVLNPGNLGRYLDSENYGTFMEFELDDYKDLTGVKLYRFKNLGEEVLGEYPHEMAEVIATYTPTEDGIEMQGEGLQNYQMSQQVEEEDMDEEYEEKDEEGEYENEDEEEYGEVAA